MERVGNIVQTVEGGAPDGWDSYGEGYQGYPCRLHTERNWKKLDIAFLKFLSFRLGTAVPCCQENTKLGEQLYVTCQFAGAGTRMDEVGGATASESAQPRQPARSAEVL